MQPPSPTSHSGLASSVDYNRMTAGSSSQGGHGGHRFNPADGHRVGAAAQRTQYSSNPYALYTPAELGTEKTQLPSQGSAHFGSQGSGVMSGGAATGSVRSAPPSAAWEKTTQGGPPAPTGCLGRVSVAVNHGIESAFHHIASFVVGRPYVTIFLVVALSAGLAQGIWFYEEELAGDKQFTSRDSEAVYDQDWVVERFGHSDRGGTLYAKHRGGGAGGVLARESLLAMLDYHVWLTAQFEVDYEGGKLGFSDVCAKTHRKVWGGGGGSTPVPSAGTATATAACEQPASILLLWGYDRAALLADPDILATVNNATRWREVSPSGPPAAGYLSKLTERDATGRVVSSPAASIEYSFKNNKVKVSGEGDIDKASDTFEVRAFEETWGSWRERYPSLELHLVTDGAMDKADTDATESDVSALSIGYVLMIIYATYVLSRRRVRYSHSILGLVSVVSVGLSTISSYGLCWFLGVKFNTVVQVLVLVLLGIGVDDAFVIMDSWWDNAHIPDMKKRMVAAMSHAGPAITITSVTDLVAFISGSTTELPALRDFCYYAALGILFDFFYQVTFFVAIAYLDSLRQESGRADCLCCVHVGPDTGCCGQNMAKPGAKPHKEADRPFFAKIIGEKLPAWSVGNNVGRTCVTLVSCVLLGIAGYGCFEKVEMNFNSEWFIPDDADVRNGMDIRDGHFAGNSLPTGIYVGDADYPAQQGDILFYNDKVASNRWILPKTSTSWLVDLIVWVNATSPQDITQDARFSRDIIRADRFYAHLGGFLDGAVGPPSAQQHLRNIVFTQDGTAIFASRSLAFMSSEPASDGQTAVDAMDELRREVAGSSPRVRVWAFPMVFWEGFKIMIEELVKNVVVAGAAVFILVSVLAANVMIAVFVTITIVCIDVCLLGFMGLVDVQVNSVSVICIVVAVGLAVDYSVHIATAFLHISAVPNPRHSARAQRAAHALWKMGPAVVNGAFSTFLAVAPLMFAKSYPFITFFRMFSLIIGFGAWFGVFFLPVVLSFIGPDPLPTASPLEPWMNPLHPDFHTAQPDDGDGDNATTTELEVRKEQPYTQSEGSLSRHPLQAAQVQQGYPSGPVRSGSGGLVSPRQAVPEEGRAPVVYQPSSVIVAPTPNPAHLMQQQAWGGGQQYQLSRPPPVHRVYTPPHHQQQQRTGVPLSPRSGDAVFVSEGLRRVPLHAAPIRGSNGLVADPMQESPFASARLGSGGDLRRQVYVI